MRKGTEFEVSKDVYERAVKDRGYMATEDRLKYFDESILCGYGLYDCKVRQEGDKYICSYMTGSTCD